MSIFTDSLLSFTDRAAPVKYFPRLFQCYMHTAKYSYAELKATGPLPGMASGWT